MRQRFEFAWEIVRDQISSLRPSHRRWLRGFNERLEALTPQERELFNTCWDWVAGDAGPNDEMPPYCRPILAKVFGERSTDPPPNAGPQGPL